MCMCEVFGGYLCVCVFDASVCVYCVCGLSHASGPLPPHKPSSRVCQSGVCVPSACLYVFMFVSVC